MMGIESQYPFQLIKDQQNAFLAAESGFGPKKDTALNQICLIRTAQSDDSYAWNVKVTGGRSFTIEDAIETAS